MARTVQDAAVLLQAAAGYDARDPASLKEAIPNYWEAAQKPITSLRLGVPWKEIETAGVHAEMQAAFSAALQEFESLGFVVRAVEPKWMAECGAANFIVLNAEEYAAHEHSLRARLNDYGPSARMYLLQGAFLSSADYLRALRVQSIVARELDSLFREVDLLVAPTSPFLTPEAARDPAVHHRGGGAVFTAPFNLTGHPAVSMPCGVSSVGLPMGIQLVGRRCEEATLLRAANSFQRNTGWTALHPALGFGPQKPEREYSEQTSSS
jgi:aspartyl-tRNA(Asn)/glutamyl-tRNA(Gln) amidotransferase subunit A